MFYFLKVIFETRSWCRSPLAPLKKGGTGLLVPLFKGDLAAVLFWGSPRIKNRQDRGIFKIVDPPYKTIGRSPLALYSNPSKMAALVLRSIALFLPNFGFSYSPEK
jgi:hypothetical protein